jgi:hypothetical protein
VAKAWLWTLYFYPLPVFLVLFGIARWFQSSLRWRPVLYFPVFVLGASALVYLFFGNYLDHIESGIVSNAWLIEKGKPLYLGLEGPERISYVYGPLVFWSQYGLLKLFGPSLFSSKLFGAICLFATLTLAFKTRLSLKVLALFSSGLLAFGAVAFYARADAPLLLSVTAASWALLRLQNPVALAAVLGISLGVAAGCKPNGFLYFVPFFAVLVSQRKWRSLAGALALSLLVFFLPFWVLPGASFAKYADLILTASRNSPPTSSELMAQNLQWLFVLLAPVFFTIEISKRSLLFFLGVVLSAVAAAIVGARPSASASHLMPLIPVTLLGFGLYPSLRTRALDEASALASFLTLTALGLWALAYQVSFASKTYSSTMASELKSLIAESGQGPVAYAFGGTDYFKLASGMLRPLIVFAPGGTHYFDLPAAGEMHLSRVPVSDATREGIRQCAVRYWIASRDVQPFTGSEIYSDLGEVFLASFEKVRSNPHFDLWRCRWHEVPMGK